MKTKLLAATLLAAACGSSQPKTTPVADTTAANAEAPAATPSTKPAAALPKAQIGAWGFDLAGMDKAIAPGDSFYGFANGGWSKATPIPADKSNYGLFTQLADLSDERTKQIIQNAANESGVEAKQIADYYQSFMDEAAIEAKGTTPIDGDLKRIAAIKDAKGVAAEFALAERHLGSSPIGITVAQDDKDPEHYIATVAQGGLGLPDRDMYDAKAAQFAAARTAYKKYVATLLTLAGGKDADKRAAAVYALEEKLASAHWTRVQNRDPQKTYNKMTLAELVKSAPGFEWKTYLEGAGLAAAPAFNVHQPSAITGAAKLVKSEPLAVWKDYLTVRLLSQAAGDLPKAFVDAKFEMYGKTLSGTPQLKDRWKRGVDEVTMSLGEAVGKIYVGKYFTPETKAAADKLVHNLLTAMGQRLDALAWMSDETKVKAKAKLAAYNPKIGYPTKWRDYSALQITAGDALGNATRAKAFEYDRRLARLGQPIDRNEWLMTPMTVNAYYEPGLNEIVFPAAILQPPFFDPNADAAVNYGGIGAVIGHEISHGFDDEGSQYDGKGQLSNWWSSTDRDKFKTATAKLVAQYSAYCPFPATADKPALCVKGELTLGENIADLAGLTVSYNAYKLSLGGKDAPVLDGLTGDQRFFLGFAQVWRRNVRDAEAQSRLVTDPHSPSESRTSVVRNLDAWYEAFAPKAGEKLFLAPDQRVKIW